MLSVFPEILFLSPLAATIIRVAVGLLFAYAAWYEWKSDLFSRGLSIVELIIAGLLIAGSWTQPAAIAAVIVTGIWYFYPRFSLYPRSTIALSLVMSVSLILTGAGAIAFDMPL